VSGGDAYVQTLSWLYAREAQAGIDLKIARVAAAAERLGHPERAAPAVHVGGTNGKGSTAAMLDAMLRAGGRRVGLYTSPHLVSFRERIVVDGVPVSEEEVVDGVARLRRDLDDARGLTAFEIMTLLAWLVFVAHAVEMQVLEVGLGGRLDATNVVTPEVAVITNVGRDHEAFLGDTIGAIAGEKAGIVKSFPGHAARPWRPSPRVRRRSGARSRSSTATSGSIRRRTAPRSIVRRAGRSRVSRPGCAAATSAPMPRSRSGRSSSRFRSCPPPCGPGWRPSRGPVAST